MPVPTDKGPAPIGSPAPIGRPAVVVIDEIGRVPNTDVTVGKSASAELVGIVPRPTWGHGFNPLHKMSNFTYRLNTTLHVLTHYIEITSTL